MKPRNVVSTVLAAAGLSWLVRAAWGLPTAMGASRNKIQPYAAASPHYRGRRFVNSLPSSAASPDLKIFRDLITQGRNGRPRRPIPLATPLAPAEAGDIAVTWFGHSSVLIEIDGRRVLTDPVWSNRVSPSALVGPARLHPVPVAAEALPLIDAVLISHDHYDHLDRDTVRILLDTQTAPFVVPLGVGAHLRRWNVPEDRIVELDWDQATVVAGITLTCTEARHFSGRGLVRDTTQWASWSIAGPVHRAFFGGDTGYTPRFSAIGESYGPFDVTLLPVGAYNEQWRDIHMNPEEAVQAHVDLQSADAGHGIVIPVHWATFNLAFHSWSEPIERLIDAATMRGVHVTVPMPGQRVDITRGSDRQPWWELN
ncbi:MBL fold metallo-hydrolase [Actinomycetes bacterium M1A6_2h]